jgi:hypothetical protein
VGIDATADDTRKTAYRTNLPSNILGCTIFVYTILVRKNITLSADDAAIERGREVARDENRTLNDAFREWLDWYGSRRVKREEIKALFERLKYADAGRKFSRDEMNER